MDLTFGKPYWEAGAIREFDLSKEDREYVWHRDEDDREIEILEGVFQVFEEQIESKRKEILKKSLNAITNNSFLNDQ